MLELYVFPPSPRAFKVLALANHLELPYELKLVDMRRGDHRAPEYGLLNPNLRMPTLREDDFVLWESNAILQYLASRRPELGLLPKDERARADVTRWQFWDLAHWDPNCAAHILEYVVKPAFRGVDEPDLAAIERVREPFHRSAKVLDAQLKGRRYVTGDTLTVADFSLGAALNLGARARMPLQEYAEIRRWFAGLSALPAWRKTMSQSGFG